MRQGILTARPWGTRGDDPDPGETLAPAQLDHDPSAAAPTREWIAAAIGYGLMLVVGIRQGGFWHADAFVALVVSSGCVVGALLANRVDRRSASLLFSLLALAAWWFVRALTTGSGSDFLPLGSSMVAFAAAFAAVRPLRGRTRELAGFGAACLGTAGAVVGFVGLIWRWYPMAMPAQGLWRLSSTLTYSDTVGLVLGVCLLLALGSDLYPALTRLAVCLCAGGLLASQSRGAYLAFVCTFALVPWRRYAQFVVPLVAGAFLGLAAIASSPRTSPVPWLGVVFLLASGVATATPCQARSIPAGKVRRVVGACAVLTAVAAVTLLLRHELTLRVFAPSNQDRSVEWSTAFHQWKEAPILGVGPDRLLVFHAADGTFAHFVHNEYLQIAAGSGLVGLSLLILSIVSVVRVVRRSDIVASCATATLVCWSIAATFDFDWHLPFIGFLGGWCVGLARQRSTGHEPVAVIGCRRPSAASSRSATPRVTAGWRGPI